MCHSFMIAAISLRAFAKSFPHLRDEVIDFIAGRVDRAVAGEHFTRRLHMLSQPLSPLTPKARTRIKSEPYATVIIVEKKS